MTLEEFKKLDILDKINYINVELSKGLKRADIYKSIGISKSTIEGQIRRSNHVFNTGINQFTSIDDNSNINVIDDNCNTCNTMAPVDESIGIIPGDIRDNIINMANEYNTFIDMINWFKNKGDYNNNTTVIEVNQGINIDLPPGNVKATTIRINETVWDKFSKFVDNAKYNKHDLMGMALLEYMEKYKG